MATVLRSHSFDVRFRFSVHRLEQAYVLETALIGIAQDSQPLNSMSVLESR